MSSEELFEAAQQLTQTVADEEHGRALNAVGLPRSLVQNGGRVLLHGQFCPMVGRMCMDQLSVDVTDVPRVSPGDVATLIGQDNGLELWVEELAQQCSTIPNELLSRLGGRLGVVVQ